MREPNRSEPVVNIGAIDLSAEPRRAQRARRRIRRVLLNGLVAVTVAGVAATGWVAWRIVSKKDVVLSTPNSIDSLNLDLSDDGKVLADSLRNQLAARIDLNIAVGAVYLDGTGRNVLFLGGTKLLWAPESVLDSAFSVIADIEGSSVSDLHTVDAGDLGGTMKCGSTKTDNGDVTVCGLADHGSLALAEFIGRGDPESATLLRRVRSATQTRS
ncbi:MAG TPA: hypothetical protein VFG35_01570 [Actinoplanes sp.]|nr:hypothetical protein [Actinoplanes sp.]